MTFKGKYDHMRMELVIYRGPHGYIKTATLLLSYISELLFKDNFPSEGIKILNFILAEFRMGSQSLFTVDSIES